MRRLVEHISSSIVHALNIKNVPRVLKLLRTGLASHREWLALSDVRETSCVALKSLN